MKRLVVDGGGHAGTLTIYSFMQSSGIYTTSCLDDFHCAKGALATSMNGKSTTQNRILCAIEASIWFQDNKMTQEMNSETTIIHGRVAGTSVEDDLSIRNVGKGQTIFAMDLPRVSPT